MCAGLAQLGSASLSLEEMKRHTFCESGPVTKANPLGMRLSWASPRGGSCCFQTNYPGMLHQGEETERRTG